jgi:hypothetical protein
MLKAYVEESAQQRERLRSLLNRLSDQDLIHPLEEGLTVSGLLGHLAFWDQRALLLIRSWKQKGVKPSPLDIDVTNDALRPLLLAIPPRRAGELALKAAGAVDQEIETLSPDLIVEIEAKVPNLRLNRGKHRMEHIAEIESALSKEK